MSWKDLLESLINDEKNTKQFTDSIIDFFVISVPKALYKGLSRTYSWMKEGTILATNSIAENYKQWHDIIVFNKMYKQQKEQRKNFCERDYRAGEVVCKHSRAFYDKRFMMFFCEDLLHFPHDVLIKKEGSLFHKGYCACYNLPKAKLD